MPKPKNGNPIAMYDFTIPVEFYTIDALKKILKGNCKRWIFQKEEGETGYEHYQVRLSLIKKKRFVQLKTETKEKRAFLLGHYSPTSNPTYYAGDFFYVMKEETRTEGPWADTDEEKVLTAQLKLFNSWPLRPYQIEIINASKIFCMRTINMIWDPTGNCGKSILAEHMEYSGLAEEIPPYRLMDDIFQWVYSRPTKKAYIVDMPRGMKKDKLADFYSGIEIIKNGVAFDKRYTAKKKRFNRPRIFVFTNLLPSFDLMSLDRWTIWKIKPDYTIEIVHTSLPQAELAVD